jgi:large subunit ribosomal protein L21
MRRPLFCYIAFIGLLGYSLSTMELAVIKTGGKQYVVSKGETITIEKLSGEHKKGDAVTFNEVLMKDDGSAVTVGTPEIKGATVKGTVAMVGRAKKIDVVKYKAKSRYLKRRGHKQPYVKVTIDSIA